MLYENVAYSAGERAQRLGAPGCISTWCEENRPSKGKACVQAKKEKGRGSFHDSTLLQKPVHPMGADLKRSISKKHHYFIRPTSQQLNTTMGAKFTANEVSGEQTP